ncbi:hypothetical protein K2173_004678 [Erythroxylum novogranatense]|uniref:Protein kinase domain-containing protein n=1 Tax=Erythroxylum novogranatense TaxID=1862640 RepID=A0AAV8T6A2_9ROSI|nr:hypothetical protein K2173_004678 [Erythroxylum novogranatense]
MDWTRGKIIGRGSSATVSVATSNASGQTFAVKSAELSQSELLRREQIILSTLKSPHIIAYKGCDITSEQGKLLYNLLLEYAPRGTLADEIRHRGGCLDEARIQSYTREILLGLEYLHSMGIVHCDIKGQNILVTDDGPKIADLGCARRIDETTCVAPIAGTPVYMAPEAARGEHQGFPADVWALGCAILEMASGQAPWASVSDPVSALYQIGFSSNVPEIPSSLSAQAKDFLGKCFKKDPMERWSAAELLQHSFVVDDEDFMFEEVRIQNVETPTSILDQEFWNTIDESATTWNTKPESFRSPPLERIGQLSDNKPNWLWDDTWEWVTVRSNGGSSEEEATSSSSKERDHLSLRAYVTESPNNEETDGIMHRSGGDYSLVIPCQPTRNCWINTCNCSSRVRRKDRCRGETILLSLSRKCSKHCFCVCCDFERVNTGTRRCKESEIIWSIGIQHACRPALFKKSMRKFNVAWWAYSFTLTLLALASAEYAREVKGHVASRLMLMLSAISVVVFLGLMLLTTCSADRLHCHNDPVFISAYILRTST